MSGDDGGDKLSHTMAAIHIDGGDTPTEGAVTTLFQRACAETAEPLIAGIGVVGLITTTQAVKAIVDATAVYRFAAADSVAGIEAAELTLSALLGATPGAAVRDSPFGAWGTLASAA